MTTYEIHGDRSLLYDVYEVSFHLRMGKKRTENYLHYLWLEKIIIPVRYRKIGSEPYWEKSSIDSLLKISKEEWDGLKIPEFDPKKNYKSMILKFPISKTKNTIPMKNKSSVKKGLYNKGEAAKRLGYSSTTSGYRYIDYLVENKFLRAIKLEGIRAPRFRVEEVEALLNKEDELGLPISKTKNSILMKITIHTTQLTVESAKMFMRIYRKS